MTVTLPPDNLQGKFLGATPRKARVRKQGPFSGGRSRPAYLLHSFARPPLPKR